MHVKSRAALFGSLIRVAGQLLVTLPGSHRQRSCHSGHHLAGLAMLVMDEVAPWVARSTTPDARSSSHRELSTSTTSESPVLGARLLCATLLESHSQRSCHSGHHPAGLATLAMSEAVPAMARSTGLDVRSSFPRRLSTSIPLKSLKRTTWQPHVTLPESHRQQPCYSAHRQAGLATLMTSGAAPRVTRSANPDVHSSFL